MTPYEEEESVSTFSRQNVQWFTRSGDIQMNAPLLNTTISRLCGVVVRVLATGPKGRGFKPRPKRWIFKGYKIRSTPSFGWEVKPEVPCCKILRHVKDTLRYFRY
jgi:hypothetical protein